MKAARKGIVEGLRNFIEVDNPCTLEVGQLNEGIRPFEVRRPKFKEGCTEASIREGSEELTLSAEEVTFKARMLGPRRSWFTKHLEGRREPDGRSERKLGPQSAADH